MDNQGRTPLNLKEIQDRLAAKRGPEYWRSLEELAETEEFRQFLEDEFPRQARPINMAVDRRQFLTLSGASLALAGLSGCRWLPQEKIVPYVNKPEDLTPGLPLYYSTTTTGWDTVGVVVTSREGRPVKIEGNPLHPASLGKTDALTQASLLNLYDQNRSQSVLYQGEVSTYPAFLDTARAEILRVKAGGGAGISILTETVFSPTLYSQIQALRKEFPGLKWHQYEPSARHNVRAGAVQAFGKPVNTIYHFDKAERILSLDGDFLAALPGHVRYAADFAKGRRVLLGTTEMNRLYSIESTPTITGSMADHRLPVRARDVQGVACALAARLQVPLTVENSLPAGVPAAWIDALVKDLNEHRGKCVVVPGDHQPPTVHLLAHAINATLGNVGTTVTYTDPVEVESVDQIASLQELVADLQADKVQVLILLDANPVYNAPADFKFAEALSKAVLKLHYGLHADETGVLCDWHVPGTHYLENWSDARAFDGTVSIVQPLIAPLYGGKSQHELLADLFDERVDHPHDGYALVHDYWKAERPSATFERDFEKILHDGVIPNTAYAPITPSLAFNGGPIAPAPAGKGLEIIFYVDPTFGDGRFANNGWLQELPKQPTKLTWDNVALVNPGTAARLGITHEDVVRLTYKDQSVDAPVWLLPGHPDNSISVQLGYGRTHAGRVGNGVGFNAYALRTASALDFDSGLDVSQPVGRYPLATTQHHYSMEGREPIREATIDEFLVLKPGSEAYDRNFARGEESVNPIVEGTSKHVPTYQETQSSLYSDAAENDHAYATPEHSGEGYGRYAWGMSVDNNVCIGCNACVIACQAENNIPVVGKDQVQVGRAMHWIRIDRYYKIVVDGVAKDTIAPEQDANDFTIAPEKVGFFDPASIQTFFQPVMCQQCENAPCEPVCPVAATVHSKEGLNQMVYNRCVGTRYCSNNCPYKVRRFNFLNYATRYEHGSLNLANNPEVTVRFRGVMEKCSYCVQRIDAARIQAKVEFREIRDGEVVTACQQVCPTNAIVFGDITRKANAVSKLKFPQQPHDYSLLGELNTRPRTTYLAKLRNPNPEIEKPTAGRNS